jgi:dTMP kinase
LPLADLGALHRIALGDFAPDLTLILDLPAAEGLARAARRAMGLQPTGLSRGSADRFERLDPEFHERLRQGFRQIAADNPARCAVIEADRPVDDVHRAVLACVADRLGVGIAP